MRYLSWLWVVSALILSTNSMAQHGSPHTIPPGPDKIYGDLFTKVQMEWIFRDQKTFADAIPNYPVKVIIDSFRARFIPNANAALPAGIHTSGVLDTAALRQFTLKFFHLPGAPGSSFQTAATEDAKTHIQRLWTALRRNPDAPVEGSSLIPLPHPYIVPGGRFGEVFYWDSYFTMLGLQASGEDSLMDDITRNFAYMLDRFGFIPNGNRTYFLSRSQPPFFSMILELLAKSKGERVYAHYQRELLEEYAYWMDKSYKTHHVVVMPDGSTLNRYYDRSNRPRPEAFSQDSTLVQIDSTGAKHLYTDLRSAAESGWDFSTRWFRDGATLGSIHTTDYIPVDLNGLLYHLELTISKSYKLTGDHEKAEIFEKSAADRKKAINKWCWDSSAGWYSDYDLSKKAISPEWTLAGLTPFFFGVAPADRIKPAAAMVQARFLKPGGLVTSLKESGQQWDAPNGWAPLEWMSITGLDNYGMHDLAKDIATRWVNLNVKVFHETGKMMEKYNVINTSLTAGGGEYPSQDGFGWTNGVLLALMQKYSLSDK